MTDHEVTIVGAGFGGMGAAIALKRLGYGTDRDLLILEREDDLGGTWHVNHYPGLAVDIASVTYSYSFEPNPHWQHWFARGRRAQAVRRARRRHLRPAPAHALRRLGRGSPLGRGRAALGRSDDPSAASATPRRFLLTATGFLSQPRLPDIEGVHDFAGEVIHTAKWDDTRRPGRQAGGVIGTGATAVQLIPRDRRGGLRADRLPAHADLGHPEDRLRDPAAAAAAVRRTAVDAAGRAPGQHAPGSRG